MFQSGLIFCYFISSQICLCPYMVPLLTCSGCIIYCPRAVFSFFPILFIYQFYSPMVSLLLCFSYLSISVNNYFVLPYLLFYIEYSSIIQYKWSSFADLLFSRLKILLAVTFLTLPFRCFQFLVVNTVNLSILCLPSIRGYVYMYYLILLLALFHRRFASYFSLDLGGDATFALRQGDFSQSKMPYLSYIFLLFSQFLTSLSQFPDLPPNLPSVASCLTKLMVQYPDVEIGFCETRQCGAFKSYFLLSLLYFSFTNMHTPH